MKKYLKSATFVKDATSPEKIKQFNELIAMFRKYGNQYSVDYLLMMAQGFQESQLDQSVKSRVGAVGVMQVMPATGKDMKVGDITKIDPNVNAGVKYMRFMIDQYLQGRADDAPRTRACSPSPRITPDRRGSGRCGSWPRTRGLNPNIWFNNVERVVAEKIGRETVTYVSNIYKYYVAYTLTMEEIQEKAKVKAATGGQR